MPWTETTRMSQRHEFVLLATTPDANIRELCRRFGVSPATGYKWITRFVQGGSEALADRSRRPVHSPSRTDACLEQVIVDLRQRRPAWGARKIRARLQALGHKHLPQPSTITDILRRHNLITSEASDDRKPYTRFEWDQPNDLWQMDFKGDFPLTHGRCHSLTILDDHSRFNLTLRACPNERGDTVRPLMIEVFRRYGLPWRLLCDNGAPWGCGHRPSLTRLGAWFIRLGITLKHGQPFHPQTQGKDERFHRSLKAEVLQGRWFHDLASVQKAYDPWRDVYNLERPHEALNMATPASRYRSSPRAFPEVLPPIEYGPDDLVRRADHQGYIRFKGRTLHVSDGVAHQPVALRPTAQDGVWDIYFCHQKLDQLDLREQTIT